MTANITSESCHFFLDISLFQGHFNTRVYDKEAICLSLSSISIFGWWWSFGFII